MSSIAQLKSLVFTPQNIFRFYKYAIYTLLAYNAYLFFQQDLAASAETFGDTVTWRNVIEAYSATFDTVAWVLLLLIFELETAIIPDHLLKGPLKWVLKTLSGVCYFFIVYSFYGYCYKYGVINNLVPFNIDDICSLIGTEFTYLSGLDDYLPLDQAVCTAMNGQSVMQVSGTEIIAMEPALTEVIRLAIIDIVNAATWLVIVVLLEVEVFLQSKDRLTNSMMIGGKYIKGFFYGLLFVCAAYWGFKGSFLDFWDAFLWLVAFIFIELNIFRWHGETEEEREHLMKV